MFGIRPDGKADKKIDPIVRATSMFMPQRSDAQVILKKELDYDAMSKYIKAKRAEGVKISHMNIIVAAFVKTVAQKPEFNRFIMNKKIYRRNEICISYAMLKDKVDDTINETTVKLKFDETDDIFSVADKMNNAITENRNISASNMTDFVANLILKIPLLPVLGVGIIRLLDRYGLLPKAIIDISPFHTSMFITNMASIRMNYVYHHIYNFGTTSIFFAMGQKEQKLNMDKEGNITKKNIMPLGIVIDERICSGAEYAIGLALMEKYLKNPELLENKNEGANVEILSDNPITI